ncbi:MAG: hypothetical protein M1814_004528 [Vezdaea aestivalis]|nr:MAG: hypothetical protein M1814_004528 [Vezdaea aestivalis]
MSDYNFGGTDEENIEIRRLQQEAASDPDKFETWEKLIRTVEGLEGGLNRNSSPLAITTLRGSYDDFLARFPLLFGYWKKYADLEFSIGGTEAAEMVYERGVASIPNSVDLWTNYCAFKVDTSHDYDIIRELFERAALNVGLDFLAHVFWDKYLEFEERAEAPDKVFSILDRVVNIPMHQYARYFERYRQLAHGRPLNELQPTDVVTQFRQDIETEAAGGAPPGATQPLSEAELEQRVRARVDELNLETFNRTQTETMKRWQYESEIKRPYFVVTELDDPQLANWRKYLDYEEEEGSFQRIVFLYERCLITCAFYDFYWLRYARWMAGQPGKEEEVRNIYQRASTIYVPIGRPGVRLYWARFEEMSERVAVAVDIHRAVLMKLPGNFEVIVSLANLQRRQFGLEAGIKVLTDHINGSESEGIHVDECSVETKGALLTKWAKMLWKNKGSVDEARLLFQKNKSFYLRSRTFWIEYLKFEVALVTATSDWAHQHQRVKAVIDEIRQASTIPPHDIKLAANYYYNFLEESAGADGLKEKFYLDVEINGPFSVQQTAKARLAVDGKAETTTKRIIRENGHPGVEVDEEAIRRGENPYTQYYQAQGEMVAEF